MSNKRDQIKTVAACMFRKKGYRASNLRDLAKEVGMKAPSLYNHISSKQALLSELLLEMAGHFTEAMDETLAADLGPVEKLKKLIAQHVQLTVAHPDAIALITSEWIHLEEPHRDEYLRLRDEYEEHFRRILTNCIEAGHFEKMNVDIALFSTLSTLRWLYSWYGKHRDISPQELENQMVSVLIDGLRKR